MAGEFKDAYKEAVLIACRWTVISSHVLALVWVMTKLAVVKMQAPAGGRRTETATVCCQRLFLMLICLLSLATPALSIQMESTESHSEFSCEPIRLRMCQDLPYNTTFMPNLLNHYDQQTAALAMEVGCPYTSCSHCMLCVHECVSCRDNDIVTCSLLQNSIVKHWLSSYFDTT